VVLVWSHQGDRALIDRLFLSTPDTPAGLLAAGAFPDAVRGGCAAIEAIARDIAAFLNGHDIRFPLGDVRLNMCSPFQRSVLRAEHAVPRGMVTSYGRIATHLGVPTGARAAGTSLARNPFPVIIPCHRAVRSDGAVGGYQGGPRMKRALLEMEDVAFDRLGRVVGEWYY
jgi:methylated-DNA-[protein]-cysteine S-methyltransferase